MSHLYIKQYWVHYPTFVLRGFLQGLTSMTTNLNRQLMHSIGFQLNVPFYLLRSLYKMSTRYKRQRLDSSLFHHDLIKILLIHHLTIMGDYWDGFLARNGFVSTIPVEEPNSSEPLVKKQFNILNNEPDTNPLDKVMPSESPHEK